MARMTAAFRHWFATEEGGTQTPPAAADPADPIAAALGSLAPWSQLLLGALLLAVGLLLVRTWSWRLRGLVPPPASPPAPPRFASMPAHWPPLSRAFGYAAVRLTSGPPRSFRPLLLPVTFLVWIGLQDLAVRIAAVPPATLDGGLTLAHLEALGWAQWLIAAGMLLFLGLWTRLFGDGLADLGLARSGAVPAAWLALSCWVAFIPLQLGAVALDAGTRQLLGAEPAPQAMVVAFQLEPAAQRSVIVWLGLALAAPLQEELLFRATLLPFLRRVAPAAVAIALNGVLFAALHDAGHLAVFTLGCGLAWLRLRTGGLVAPIVFHVVHNGVTLTALARLG